MEYESISHQEFRQLLVGLNGETSLGYTVQIRSEKDPKKISQMTNKEKQIRNEWMEFKRKHSNNENKITITKENIDSIFSKIFG